MFQKKFPQATLHGGTGVTVRTRGPCCDARLQVVRPCQRQQSGKPSIHGPVAAHCMIVLKPKVPRRKLIWSLSCTVNAPSMIPAMNTVVTTTLRSDMAVAPTIYTLPRLQIEPFRVGSVPIQHDTALFGGHFYWE